MKYNEWAQHSTSQANEVGYCPDWSLQSSPQLAMFYARAKQTFVTPYSDYELDLPSDILASFHVPNPHPHPATFAEVASETKKLLQESLERFVTAAYNNGGNNRVMCGAVGGIALALAGSIPLIAYNFAHGKPRWLRLTALPAMWFGLTALFSALNGICLMVYMMGDLRQLRKFEMSRPPISKPRPLTTPHQLQTRSSPVSGRPITPILPITQTPPPLVPPPPAYIHDTQSLPRSSISSYVTSSSRSVFSSSRSSTTETAGEIQISPAYIDEARVEGPATSPSAVNTTVTRPLQHSIDGSESRTNSFANTASFIHPFYTSVNEDYDLYGPEPQPQDHQPISAFDFDALPSRRHATTPPPPAPPQPRRDILIIEPEAPKPKQSARAFIAYLQSKCNIYKWQVVTGGARNTDVDLESSSADLHNRHLPRRRDEKSETNVRAQFKLIRAVPAFASPLTRVLSPIVVRGQWEIVTRSAIIAMLISWVILGSLLAVPVVR